MNTDFSLGIACGVVVVVLALFVAWAINDELKKRKTDRGKDLTARLNARDQQIREDVSVMIQTFTSDFEKKMLAIFDDQPQNVSNRTEPPQPPKDDEPPFWQNRERLKAASELLQESPDNHGISELGDLSGVEAWRAVDEKLVQLTEATETP